MTDNAINAALSEVFGVTVLDFVDADTVRNTFARHGLALVPAGESAAGAKWNVPGCDYPVGPAPQLDQREAAMRSADKIRARLENMRKSVSEVHYSQEHINFTNKLKGEIASLERVLSPSKPQEPRK